MKKPVIFAFRKQEWSFGFIPFLRYDWSPCSCWAVSLGWGNLSVDVFTTCNKEFLDSLSRND